MHIKNSVGRSVSALTDYKEWLEVKRGIKQTIISVDVPENPLDWYTLTETTNSILNELLAYVSREKRKELKKLQPDTAVLNALEQLFDEVYAINDNPEHFRSLSCMNEIIEKYGPKEKAIYEEI